MNKDVYLSIVSTIRNEEDSIKELHRRLQGVGKKLGKSYEIIYVENGSSDNSLKILRDLRGAIVIVLRVPPNFSRSTQTAAMDAGIKHSKGEIIVTIDSDLQNPPEEIPNLIHKLEKEELDVVSGWRKKRKDRIFIRSLSKFGSILRERLINPGIHDLGCTLKVYRRECFEGLDLYGEMHRYIPAVLAWRGFRIGEIVVRHDARKYGKSKYSARKMFRGFVDMLLVWFLKKYADRPLHLFGISGIVLTLFGGGLLGVLGIMRLLQVVSLAGSIWPLIAILCILAGIQLFSFGIVLDMLMRSYFAIGKEKPYSIKEVFEN